MWMRNCRRDGSMEREVEWGCGRTARTGRRWLSSALAPHGVWAPSTGTAQWEWPDRGRASTDLTENTRVMDQTRELHPCSALCYTAGELPLTSRTLESQQTRGLGKEAVPSAPGSAWHPPAQPWCHQHTSTPSTAPDTLKLRIPGRWAGRTKQHRQDCSTRGSSGLYISWYHIPITTALLDSFFTAFVISFLHLKHLLFMTQSEEFSWAQD